MTNTESRFVDLAMKPSIMVAALKISLIVGTLLALINHGSALTHMELDSDRILQIMLTYFVPYCVSTYSAVKAIQEREKVINKRG
tara:strand:- start:11195 stop:11449 length:255 start_codon:yes stop_codon:yes gene_type:complete